MLYRANRGIFCRIDVRITFLKTIHRIILAIYGDKCYNLRKLFGDSMMYIFQNPDWHNFRWCGEKIQKLLLDIKKAQGYLLGKMDSLGFYVKNNALLQVLT